MMDDCPCTDVYSPNKDCKYHYRHGFKEEQMSENKTNKEAAETLPIEEVQDAMNEADEQLLSETPKEGPGHPMFYRLLDAMRATHDAKNSDYTGDQEPLANLKKCEELGVPAWKGVLVRLTDKFMRIQTLASGKEAQVKDESLEDTLMDQAVYSLLAIILLREARNG